MQREFAEQGIRMRVADAKAAGVHPLYALGANTPGYSPVMSAMPQAVSEAGQHIGRAIDAAGSSEDRALARQLAVVQLRNAQLQGDYIQEQIAASQFARLNQGGQASAGVPGGGVQVFPVDPFPSERVQGSDLVEIKPRQITSSRSDAPEITAGHEPGYSSFRLDKGNRFLGLSGELSQATEEMDALRYYLTFRANFPEFAQLADDAYKRMFAPDWVRRLELRLDRELEPVRVDGKLFWRETGRPAKSPIYRQMPDRSDRYPIYRRFGGK